MGQSEDFASYFVGLYEISFKADTAPFHGLLNFITSEYSFAKKCFFYFSGF